jgi:hypothetical protein
MGARARLMLVTTAERASVWCSGCGHDMALGFVRLCDVCVTAQLRVTGLMGSWEMRDL